MPEPITIETLTYRDVAKTIDHSSAAAGARRRRPSRTGCELALRYDVASVCVKPSDVALAASILAGSDVMVGTVVGFPHGASLTATKVFEAERALEQGAVELDMVINIGQAAAGDDA